VFKIIVARFETFSRNRNYSNFSKIQIGKSGTLPTVIIEGFPSKDQNFTYNIGR
jgi:hypothetical protein